MDKIRLGNISYRHLGNEKHLGEILCCYPNPYYGREKDYQWTKDGEFAYVEDWRARHHKSCFVHKEACYVVAFVEDCGDEAPDIRSVGSRPFNLNEEDSMNFVNICKSIFEQWTTETM